MEFNSFRTPRKKFHGIPWKWRGVISNDSCSMEFHGIFYLFELSVAVIRTISVAAIRGLVRGGVHMSGPVI